MLRIDKNYVTIRVNYKTVRFGCKLYVWPFRLIWYRHVFMTYNLTVRDMRFCAPNRRFPPSHACHRKFASPIHGNCLIIVYVRCCRSTVRQRVTGNRRFFAPLFFLIATYLYYHVAPPVTTVLRITTSDQIKSFFYYYYYKYCS